MALKYIHIVIQPSPPSISTTFASFQAEILCLFFFFKGPHPQHMEISRLGFESELQLPAYTTATATSDPSCICDLHHSSWQCQIINPLSEARDQTGILMDPSVNNAALTVGIQVSVWIPAFSSFGFTPEMELLDHMVFYVLRFWGTTILFCTMATPFYIPISDVPCSSFSTSLPTLLLPGIFRE